MCPHVGGGKGLIVHRGGGTLPSTAHHTPISRLASTASISSCPAHPTC